MMHVKISKQNHMRFKANSYKTGLFAEWMARWVLRLHGFKIVQTRYVTGRYTGRAEIDIIARRGNLLIFVEVKCRPDITSGLDAITPAQIVRLRAAAETYMARMRYHGDARFDVMIVVGMRCHWIRGAI